MDIAPTQPSLWPQLQVKIWLYVQAHEVLSMCKACKGV